MAEPAMRTMFTPHSSGFYAANNQFQLSGPRGFIEFKLVENNDLYVRVDLPGVVGDGDSVRHWTDGDKNQVFFKCEAPKESEHDESGRSYLGSTGVICDCCHISGIKTDLKDGVFRMIIQKVKVKEDGESCKKIPHSFSGGSQSSDGAQSSDGFGQVLQHHPYVIKGPKEPFEAKLIKDGGLYGRIDLPGVAKGDARVFFKDGEVRFFGNAKGFMKHETGRDYLGSVACPSTYKVGNIQFQMKNGILRITISRVQLVW